MPDLQSHKKSHTNKVTQKQPVYTVAGTSIVKASTAHRLLTVALSSTHMFSSSVFLSIARPWYKDGYVVSAAEVAYSAADASLLYTGPGILQRARVDAKTPEALPNTKPVRR